MDRDDRGRFAPGNPGGPGRPRKGEALTDILSRKIDKEEMATLLIEKAREGDFAAMKYIYDRIDGAPKQSIDAAITEIPRYIGFNTPDEDESEDSGADTE